MMMTWRSPRRTPRDSRSLPLRVHTPPPAMLTRAYPAVRSAAADRPGDASRRARRVAGTTRVSGGRLTERSRPARISSTRFARRRAVRPRSGDPGSRDPSRWRVRQVYGDGKVLLDQLREVADLLAEGFDASGRSSKDLLNGLVQKVRWSGGDFVCLVADDGADGSAMVGACDLTLLPAGGPKRSREGRPRGGGGGPRKKARQEAGTEIKILSAAAFCVRALAGQLWRALV